MSSGAAASCPHEGLPRVCVVGPLPPPSGGMANQCEQLVRLLRSEGVPVDLVCNNPPYRPHWVGNIPVLRAGVRLLPYLWQLWQAAGRNQVLHVLANSGWAWHLFALPAVVMGRWRGAAVIINYRGGHADTFFSSAPRHVLATLASVRLRVTPSAYLLRVFAQHGLDAVVIPNIVDLRRFSPGAERDCGHAPHLVVTRNLEPIYDIPTALRAFGRVRRVLQGARLTIAGTGPQLPVLEALVTELGLQDAVCFSGRIDNADIPALYAQADCMLNPSTVDNMPISILEAFASGVPVVSTAAGGIPDLLQDGVEGLLVPVGDDRAMADAALALLQDTALRRRLRQAGLAAATRYAWPRICDMWLDAYRHAARPRTQP